MATQSTSHNDNPLVEVAEILDAVANCIKGRVRRDDYAEEWQSLMATVENVYEDIARALSKLNVCHVEEVKDMYGVDIDENFQL